MIRLSMSPPARSVVFRTEPEPSVWMGKGLSGLPLPGSSIYRVPLSTDSFSGVRQLGENPTGARDERMNVFSAMRKGGACIVYT